MSVTIDNLVVKYGNKLAPALAIEHLQISEGVIAVVGENGAGKSTLFKTLQGFLSPELGNITKVGKSPNFSSVQVFQSEQSFDYVTVKEWVEFHGLLRGVKLSQSDISNCIQGAQLQGREKHFVSKLSGGQQRKLNLLCASFGEPDLIILDEPTTGLDQEARKEYWGAVNKYRETHSSTILFSSHYMEEVENNANQVILLRKGRLVANGSPADLIKVLGISYVAIVPRDLSGVFSREKHYFDEAGRCIIYVSNIDSFFAEYGSMEKLVQNGVQLRKPNMSDVYTKAYKEN